MNPLITGPLAALVAGLVTSLHCAGMCGPLACAVCLKSNGTGSLPAAAAYHGFRIISYGAVGLLAGLLGRAVADVLLGGTGRWLTWAFVVFFVFVATGLDKRMRFPLAGNWMAKCWSVGGLPANEILTTPVRAAMLGFLTPLIPCGPFYLIVAAAAISGSAVSGALVMLAFAVGTVPLIFALQSQYFRIGARFSPGLLERLRRSLAVVSIGLLVYRGMGDSCFLCQ